MAGEVEKTLKQGGEWSLPNLIIFANRLVAACFCKLWKSAVTRYHFQHVS